jgi:acyl-CoA thioester hydrolase
MLPLFEYRLRVRYGECDAQGVVFNARYADYLDLAATEYTRALFGSYERLLQRDLDTQVVSLSLQWKHSAVYDDVLAIRVSPGAVGNTSFTLLFGVHRQHDDVLIATAEVVYVMVAVSLRGKTPVPDDLRTVLQQGAPGLLVSHAGDHLPASSAL